MGYYPDFAAISLSDYARLLQEIDLVPSRAILLEQTALRFKALEKAGIHHLADVLAATKTRPKLIALFESSLVDIDFLTVLGRELRSYQSKPNNISDFPELAPEISGLLEKAGIKNTLQLYDRVITLRKRQELAEETGIDSNIIDQLAHLTDLSRIQWVNHTFAYLLYQTGYDSARKIARADAGKLYKATEKWNAQHQLFKGKVGLRDIKRIIQAAQWVPEDIEF
ncbi:MAG TPA: hypothetical protein DDY13_14280 [Cytophagales bacterium]|jgi:hypothetical protein|nr:hypothetical protein [Cytophagales bacterium]